MTSAARLIQYVVGAATVLIVVAGLVGRYTNWGWVAGSWTFAFLILTLNGEALIDRLGRIGGLAAWGLLLVAICGILFRIRNLRATDLLVNWLALYLVLAPIGQAVSFAISNESAQIDTNPHVLPTTVPSNKDDLVVVFLDGYSGWTALERDFGIDGHSNAADLRELGLYVPGNAWAAYPMTILSIPSTLDLTYPVAINTAIGGPEVSSLARIIGGQNTLVATLKAAGYKYTHIESGWYAMNCGKAVDVCRTRPLLDDVLGFSFRRSIIGAFGVDPYAHAFKGGVVNAMIETEHAVERAIHNDVPDLIISHIIAPHPPFILGPNCARLSRPVGLPIEWTPLDTEWSLDELKAAYVGELHCITEWLPRLVKIANRGASVPALLITSDHGSAFRGQMERPVETWSGEDVHERLSILLATQAPEQCGLEGLETPIETMAALLNCLTGAELDVSRRHFVVSKASPVTEVSAVDLEVIGS
ncbi:MAG TPA: hypothetical protein VJ935_10010 [Acidimicrobiia bacterium]|nr:hypothetical protein [Acidimicrobiia bacterium]